MTSTVWTCWVVNPHPSVAVKVLNLLNSLGQEPFTNASSIVSSTALQASVAETFTSASKAPRSTGQFWKMSLGKL